MYCPGCGRAIPENVKFCSHCGRPVGGDPVATPLSIPAEKRETSTTITAIIVVAIVIAIAAILVISIGLLSLAGSSASVRVTVSSTTSMLTVYYDVYFDDSLVKSGSLGPFSAESFEHTHRWSSSDPATVVISVESTGILGSFYSDQRTISVSDGGHYAVNLVV